MSEALFTTKAVKIDTLGEYLSSVRKQLNMDLKTVSLLSQIKPSYLEELEAGRYDKLPAEIYVKGFLKSLSELYHIKEQILIDQYEKERGVEPKPVVIQPKPAKKFGLTPRMLIIGSAIILLVGALSYIGWEIQSVLVPPMLTVSDPATDTTVQGDSIVISGQTEVGADVYINNQAVLADVTGQFTEPLILSPGLNVVAISAKNKFGKVSTVTRQINSQVAVSAPPAPASVNLTVNIGPGNAWVSIEADGAVVQQGTMLAGSTKTVTAQSDIVLTSANAGATDVIYNGKDLGKLGREGEVVRNVEFQPQ